MRALSLSPASVLPCSPLEQVDAALEAGFDAIGLRLFPTLQTDVDVMADADMRNALERRILETGLQVLDIEVVRATPRIDIGAIVAPLEFASSLGARWLAVTSAAVDDYRSEEEPLVVERLAELCEVAGRHGMGVMLEFMAFRGVATLDDAVRVVAAVGRANLGITFDALHFFRSGGAVADLAAIDPRMLACVQLCDAPLTAPPDLASEARHGRLYPGEGELPLRELIAVLPEDMPTSVEVPSRARAHLSASERATECARWTRQLFAAIDQPSTRLDGAAGSR